MGLFSSLKKGVNTFVDANLAINAHPLRFLSNPKKAIALTKSESNIKVLTNSLVTATTVATLGGTSVGKKIVQKGISLLTPKTAVGAIAQGSIATIGGTTLLTSETARDAVLNVPSGLVNIGANTGNLIENPSVENATKILKENPVLAGTLGALAAAYFGFKTAGTAANVLNAYETRKNTKALNEKSDEAENFTGGTTNKGDNASSAPTINYFITSQPTTPPLPEETTSTIEKPKAKGKKKKKKSIKRRKAKKKYVSRSRRRGKIVRKRGRKSTRRRKRRSK